jgi:cell wall-associated NlpC family hydrolase
MNAQIEPVPIPVPIPVSLWASGYLGIPYDVAGESRSGANCWGFFRLVQREVFGLHIPALGISGADIKALLDAFHDHQPQHTPWRAHWRALPLAQARSGDALLFERRIGWPDHIGIALGCHLGEARVLHCIRGIGSLIEPIERLKRHRWQHTTAWRHVP